MNNAEPADRQGQSLRKVLLIDDDLGCRLVNESRTDNRRIGAEASRQGYAHHHDRETTRDDHPEETIAHWLASSSMAAASARTSSGSS